MSRIIFPVRPRPFADESFPGFLLRVCHENGRASIRQLFQILELPNRPSSYHSRGGDFLNLISRLAPSLMMEDEVLTELFNTEPRFFSELRSIRDVKIRHPKFCPECLVEKGYCQKSWELITNTHCPTHKTILVDRCSACGNMAQWDNFNLSCCSFCSTSWLRSERTDDLPPFLRLTPAEPAFDVLINTFHLTLRPNDLIFESMQTLSIDNESIHFHLMQAHYLLSNLRFREEWFSNYSAIACDLDLQKLLTPIKRDLGNSADIYPSFATSDKYIEDQFKVKREINGLCKNTRLKLANTDADLNAQLKISEAASYLAINLRDLLYLTNKKIVRSLNADDPWRMQIFDVRDLKNLEDELIARCTRLSADFCVNNLISLFDFGRRLTHFNIHKGQFFELLNESDLTLLWPESGRHWGDIRVDLYSLIDHLEYKFIDALPKTLSSKQFRAITSVNVGTPLGYDVSLPKSKVIDFCDRYINVNRLARLHAVSTQRLKLLLAKEKVLVAKASPSAINPIAEKTDVNWNIIKKCISAIKAVS